MKASDLVAAIFDDCQTPYAYVSAPTVIDSEKQLYDPLLSAMRRLGCYHGFDGRKVADFLRKNLVAENEHGKIIKVCFGREYSPALYLTLTSYDAKKDRTEAHDLLSGCRTLAGLTGDWRPLSELAGLALAWFMRVNLAGMRREARCRGLTPKF